ncbi:MAG: ThuA domain-containing protein [Tepidisphaeraceae bacterium]|jgi:type 1 glutamine amidotransferase
MSSSSRHPCEFISCLRAFVPSCLIWTTVLVSFLPIGLNAAAQEKKVLVYTRQAKTIDGKPGFIHNNTKAAVEMIRKLGADSGFAVDVSEDPAVFTEANLKQYKVLVFSNTNNQIFDTEDQQAALQKYIRGGGGFVGIHSATGSMRAWPWFCSMIGGRFQRHPKLQPFTIKVVDHKNPSTSFLGGTWKWEDEFYYHQNLAADNHILLAGDLSTLTDKDKPQTADNTFPLAWCREFEGARIWYTALGHKPEYYSDPDFQKHILGGILWAMEGNAETKEPAGAK